MFYKLVLRNQVMTWLFHLLPALQAAFLEIGLQLVYWRVEAKADPSTFKELLSSLPVILKQRCVHHASPFCSYLALCLIVR